jgi:hypothetical protein
MPSNANIGGSLLWTTFGCLMLVGWLEYPRIVLAPHRAKRLLHRIDDTAGVSRPSMLKLICQYASACAFEKEITFAGKQFPNGDLIGIKCLCKSVVFRFL